MRRTYFPSLLVAFAVSAVATAQSLNFRSANDYSREHEGLAVLVYHGGELVFEDYHNGHSREKAHHIYSGTKSFAPIVALIAQADGLLELDEPVAKTITEWAGDPKREKITIRHLLDFTSGLEHVDAKLHRRKFENKYEIAVAAEARRKAGERFQYGSVHLTVFGELIKRKLRARDPKKHADSDFVSFLDERLLEPIGCECSRWMRDSADNPMVAYGAFLTAREWAKFGLFLLNRGRVGDEQIVDEKALAACFVGSKANPNYGLNFWLFDQRRVPSAIPKDTIGAFGMFKQKLYVIPSRKLVVVRFGKEGARSAFRDSDFLERLLTAPAKAPSADRQAPVSAESGG